MVPFTLLDKISDGSAADLFRAQRPDQAQVFVELSREVVSQRPPVARSFLLEAQARKNLTNAAIARRERLGQLEDGRWFVMSEPVAGESLQQRVAKRGPLPPEEVAHLLATLCEGLEYLHRRGLTHGNLDPRLVFVHIGGAKTELKLLDTGLTLMRAPGLVAGPGRRLVQPEYLSPERIRGQRATPLSDIYGLGVLGYELLLGRPPFQGLNPEEVRRQHLEWPVPLFPESAGLLGRILQRCLCKSSEERWPTADMLRVALSRSLSPSQTGASVELDISLDEGSEQARALAGSYELLRKIGEGAMGEVYLARHTRVCKEVALKILRPELAQDRELVQRFFQEARAATRINHEHIVEVFDLLEEPPEQGGRVFFVMELLHGATLRDLAGRKPLPIGRSVHVVRQVAEALEAAHRAGIVHRDVKPENIFVIRRAKDSSYAKLLDFGVAKLLASDPESMTRTSLGTPLGTPTYMSPEQARGETVDARTDIYSLGVVLFHLLSGKVPHEAPTLSGLLVAIATQPPAQLPTHSSGGETIPPSLRALILRCLEKDPARRPQSMAELGRLLAEFESPPHGGSSGEGTASSPWRRGGLIGGALAVLLGLGHWMTRSPPEEVPPARVPTPPVAPKVEAKPPPPKIALPPMVVAPPLPKPAPPSRPPPKPEPKPEVSGNSAKLLRAFSSMGEVPPSPAQEAVTKEEPPSPPPLPTEEMEPSESVPTESEAGGPEP